MTPERIEARVGIFIAVLALGAAWYQGKIARDTLHDSQRPFLSVEEITLVGGAPDGKGPYFVNIKVSNSGETQARRVHLTYGMGKIEPTPAPNWQPAATFIFDETGSTFMNIIPPKDAPGVLASIDTEVVNGTRELRNGLLVYGTIRYCDIFKISHMTQFCQKFEFRTVDPAIPNKDNFVFGTCIPHSCDDDDCPDYAPKDSAKCSANE